MKKNIFTRLLSAFAAASVMFLAMTVDAKAYDSNRFVKANAGISDISVNTFGTYYDVYIPVGLKVAFESDGGMFLVIPNGYPIPNMDQSGWAGGGVVTGACGYDNTPVIYLNSYVVENQNRFQPGVDSKTIMHEFGHYVHLKSSQLKCGYVTYMNSPELVNAFNAEFYNINIPNNMPASLKSSFARNTNVEEFYANVFAGLLIDPQDTVALFPQTSTIVMSDTTLVSSAYGY